MANFDDVMGFITDPFTGKSVHGYKYDSTAGEEALKRQSAQARQAAVAQQYSLASAGGSANPSAIRAAQANAARTSQSLNQQALTAQLQYQQQMEAMRGQAAMQSQMANAQLDAQRDSSIMGMAGAAIGGAALLSDPSVKEDIFDIGTGPRPAPARSSSIDPYGPAVRPAPARSQMSEEPYIDMQGRPGDRRAYESTGAGFGRDYGFDWGQVRNSIGQPSRRDEAAIMERHAAEQGIDLGPSERAQLQTVSGMKPDQTGAMASAAADKGGFGQVALDVGQGLLSKGQGGPNMIALDPSANYRMIDFSDLRTKRNVEPMTYRSGIETKRDVVSQASDSIVSPGRDLVDQAAQVGSYAYNYDPKFARKEGLSPEQRITGPMANGGPDSLEASPVYAPAVKYGRDGLARVDAGRAALANVAVTSELARRQQALESDMSQVKRAAMRAPTGREALESAVESEAREIQPAAFGGERIPEFEDIPEGRRPAPKASGPDRVAPRGTTYTIPWEELGSWDLSTVPRGFSARKVERPDAPTQFDVEVEGPGGASFPSQYDYRNPIYGELNMGDAETRAMRTMRTNERARGSTRQVEDVMGDAAADINTSKSATDRRAKIREIEKTLRGGGGVTPSPDLVFDELRERGVKIKKKEVVDALRDEVYL